MQIIHVTDEEVGSLDWELPPYFAKIINVMPEASQKRIREDISGHAKALLLTVIATYVSRNPTRALNILMHAQQQLITTLLKHNEEE